MCYIFRQRKTSRLYILGSTKNIMVLATILSFATYGRQPIHLPRAVRLIAYYRSWLSGQYASDLLNPTRTFLSFSLQLREYGKLQSENSAALSQFILHDLLCSSMSAEPPPKSPQLLPQLDKRPERQWGHCRWRVNVHRLSQWAERNRKIGIPPPQAPAERQTSGHL